MTTNTTTTTSTVKLAIETAFNMPERDRIRNYYTGPKFAELVVELAEIAKAKGRPASFVNDVASETCRQSLVMVTILVTGFDLETARNWLDAMAAVKVEATHLSDISHTYFLAK